MRLAPSRLRPQNLISSSSSSTIATPAAFLFFPSCRHCRLSTIASTAIIHRPIKVEGKGIRRNSAATAIVSSFRQPAHDQSDSGDDDAYPPELTPSGADAPVYPTTSSLSSAYLSRLKHRGQFQPGPLDNDSSDILSSLSHRPNGQAMLSTHHYGKWRELLFDTDQLSFEAGFQPASALVGGGRQRAVDLPENSGDFGLWGAIFNFAYRRKQRGGALFVWREVFQRRQLYKTDKIVARAFWQDVVESALDDESFLESTWAYAEWMRDEHDAYWPHYYQTIVTAFLNNGEYERALRWHVRLSPHFGIGRVKFFDILKGFLTNPDRQLQETLQQIYATSRQRLLYDTIVPLLWSQGHSALAQKWREVLLRHNDLPTSSASRPFVQFLAGYYPEIELCMREQTIVNGLPWRQSASTPSDSATPSKTSEDQAVRKPKEQQQKLSGLPKNVYHLLNRAHGIRQKPFNDRIGSQWFATTWVTLDMAFSLVYSLGVAEIGPLSLQSIAIREGTPAGLLHRLEQLGQYQISVRKSNYTRAIRHFAKIGDAETLDELVHSTLHPDVFDDTALQREMIDSSRFTGDWKTHRLLLAVRLAVSEDTIAVMANRTISTCLDRHRSKKKAIIKLLDEMVAREIELLSSTAHAMLDLIVNDVPRKFTPQTFSDVDFYIALCRRLAALCQPIATEAWQNILFLLGRQGRLLDFERVALDIADRFVAIHSVDSFAGDSLDSFLDPSPNLSHPNATPAFKVHISDVPDVVRSELESAELGYRLLPRDLPLDHPLHPVNLVFNEELTQSIVRWYFHRKMAYRQGRHTARSHDKGKTQLSAGSKGTEAFSMASGIRLLGMLRDRGVAISEDVVKSEALLSIAAVFGPESLATRYWKPARSMNQLTLAEVKGMCDAAWAEGGSGRNSHGEGRHGQPLLPPVEVLEKSLAAIRPALESFGQRLTRQGENMRMSREAFLDAVSQQQSGFENEPEAERG